MNIPFIIGLQLALIALNAVFACAEIAMISINDTKLAKLASEGDKRAIRLQKLTGQPARFLATIQVAITLSGFLGSAFAAENFAGILASWLKSLGAVWSMETLESISVIVITIILSFLTLVFGELLPKQIAMRNAEKLALGLSGLIAGVSKLCAPLVCLLTASTNGVLRLVGIDPNAPPEEVGEEEIRMMAAAGSESGAIDEEEREFIDNVFDFDNTSAEEIVTHRTEIAFLYAEDSLEEWDKTITETRFTYYPICDETPDKVVGVLNTKIYFRIKDKTKKSVLKQAVTEPYIVPESLKADVLFRNMKKEHQQFAVVLDEYGGLSGVITIKDLIEELVGELDDDTPEEETVQPIVQLEDDLWQAEGGVLLEELSEVLELPLESEEYETLNGLIFHHLGTTPEENDQIEVENLHISVAKVRNFQVELAILRKIPTQAPTTEE